MYKRQRQSPNVYRMHLLGATVVPVESGSKTLKDALNEAPVSYTHLTLPTIYSV